MGKKNNIFENKPIATAEKLAEKIIGILCASGLSSEEIDSIILHFSDKLADRIAVVVSDFLHENKKIIYPISVDYEIEIEKMVESTRHEWTNEDIVTNNFSTTKKGKKDIGAELMYFGRSISSEEAINEMDKAGYRSADLHEFLAFGSKYPHLQRWFPIVELGSSWHNKNREHFVVYMSWGASGRYLHLWHFGLVWGDGTRFLAVKKEN